MKKTTVFLLLLVLATALVFAAGNQESAGTKEAVKRFAFVSPIIGHPYWVTVADGVADASKEFNASTRESGPIGEINIDTQIRDIETAIASKVDGILTMALNPEAFTPVINRAISAGIPVVLIDTDAPASTRSAYAGTSNFDAGYSAGKALAEATGGSANIGIITGAIDADNLNLRIDGFRKAIAEYPGMTVIDVQDSNSNMLIQTEKAQSMLQAFPQLNAFFGTDATSAIAAAKIVQEKGLAGKVSIVGFDDLDETLDYIRSGVINSTAVQRNYMMGYLGVELLVRLANGESLESDIIDTGVTMVTKANVDSY
jgi:ribose transport system substrate-binding protein